MSDKLRAAAKAVLKNAKSLFLGCGDFNHLKKDFHDGGKCPPLQRYNDALAALKAALAKPAIKESLTGAEPVAWLVTYGGLTHVEYTQPNMVVDTRYQPLYTAPLAEQKPMLEINPEKREWVGLTGDEIEDLPKDKTWWEIIRAAEEILKEKNT